MHIYFYKYCLNKIFSKLFKLSFIKEYIEENLIFNIAKDKYILKLIEFLNNFSSKVKKAKSHRQTDKLSKLYSGCSFV